MHYRSLVRGGMAASVLLAFSAGVVPVFAETPAYVEPAVWAPYFKDDKGVKSNLVEPMEKNSDKQWFGMEWTKYRGPKLLMSVQMVDNTKDPAAAMPGYAGQQAAAMAAAMAAMTGRSNASVPISGIEDMLATALMNSQRFDLLERKSMADIMAEKRLDASKDEAPAVDLQKNLNKLVTAAYTIKASVTEWTPDKSKKGGAVGGGSWRKAIPIIGMIDVSKSTAEVAMSFRIIDNSTSKVVDSVTVRATAENWGFGLAGFGMGGGGGAGGAGGMQEKSPINYAVGAAINKGVYLLAKRLGDKPWSSKVSMNRNGVIYVVGGEKDGLAEGMILQASKLGEAIKDPSTGEILDQERTALGQIKITAVKEKISLAVNVNGCETIGTGDLVEAAAGPSVFNVKPQAAPAPGSN